MRVAGFPATDGHLQGVVGGQQSGQQGQVGHGAGAVLRVDPDLDGLSFIGVTICWSKQDKRHQKLKQFFYFSVQVLYLQQ